MIMRALMLVAGLVAVPFCAARAAPLPVYEVGQAFIFDNGRVERVRSVNDDAVVWATRSGRTYLRATNPVVPILEWSYRGQTGQRTVLGEPDRLWPLQPGRSVQFRTVNVTLEENQRRPTRSLHLWSCSVRRAEMVNVPAGRFSAHPIVCDRFSANSMRVLERLTWHYASEVGHYIQREARNMTNGQSEIYRLSAALPPHAANDLRVESLARLAQSRD